MTGSQVVKNKVSCIKLNSKPNRVKCLMTEILDKQTKAILCVCFWNEGPHHDFVVPFGEAWISLARVKMVHADADKITGTNSPVFCVFIEAESTGHSGQRSKGSHVVCVPPQVWPPRSAVSAHRWPPRASLPIAHPAIPPLSPCTSPVTQTSHLANCQEVKVGLDSI